MPIRRGQPRACPDTAGTADAGRDTAGTHDVASQPDDVAPGAWSAPSAWYRCRSNGDHDGPSAHHDEQRSSRTRGRHFRPSRLASGARRLHATRTGVDDAATGRACRADVAFAQQRYVFYNSRDFSRVLEDISRLYFQSLDISRNLFVICIVDLFVSLMYQ